MTIYNLKSSKRKFWVHHNHFYRTEPLFWALLWYVVVSSPQHGENTAFFSNFPFGGLHSWGILLIIPLELQRKRHQPFSMAQPKKILCLGLCGVRSPHHASPIRNTRFGKPPSGGPSFSKALSEHLVVLYLQYAENTVFLIFHWWASWLGASYWLFLWNFKK